LQGILNQIFIFMHSILRSTIIVLLYLAALHSSAQTDKYRLSYRDDPATSVVIAWSGASAEVCFDTIDHGINWSQYAFRHGVDRAIDYKGMSNFFARLSGLKPNKTYYFVVKSSLCSDRFYFKTLTERWNNKDTVSFISGGDTRTGLAYEDDYTNCRTYRMDGNRLVAAIRPDFIAFGGDFVYEVPGVLENEQAWKDWFDDWQYTKTFDGQMFPLVIAFGNHEIAKDVYNLFDIPNENDYYALTFGGNLFRLYNLSTEVDACNEVTQRNWLENDLSINSNSIYQPYWKIAQYHAPMHSHVTTESDRQDMIDCWAPKFHSYGVKLVMENHSHIAKYTWPIIPSTESGNDHGFIRNDVEGTVYVGDGSWGAPMFILNSGFDWTRNAEMLHCFQLVWISGKEIQVRTVNFANANLVYPLTSRKYTKTLPQNLKIWNPSNGSVVILNNPNIAGIDNRSVTENNSRVYPNPTTGFLHIDLAKIKKDRIIQIYNALGKLILEKKSDKGSDRESIDLNNKSKGIYYIYIKADDHFEMHKVSLQ